MKVKLRRYKKSLAPVVEEQSIETMDEDLVHYYCEEYRLMNLPINMLDDCLKANIYIDKNGEKFALVPLLWLYNFFQSPPSKTAN